MKKIRINYENFFIRQNSLIKNERKEMIKIILLFLCLLFFLNYKNYMIVIKTIAYESKGECLKGQIAVANTIKARIKDKRWPNKAKDVVLQPYQFTCWNSKNKKPILTKKEIKKARLAWKLSRHWKYNHYYNKNKVPYWVKNSKSFIQIGNHIFCEL